MPEDPLDPFTPAQEGMVALHQIYLDLRAGGFSMTEACIIVAGILNGGGSPGNE